MDTALTTHSERSTEGNGKTIKPEVQNKAVVCSPLSLRKHRRRTFVSRFALSEIKSYVHLKKSCETCNMLSRVISKYSKPMALDDLDFVKK
jgi:hypothetical protein